MAARADARNDGGGAAPPGRDPEGFLVAADATTRIHFLDWGAPDVLAADAAAIVLLHGVAGTAWTWAPVARQLSSTRRVVAVDLRGHGLSDAPTDGYDLDGLAADVEAVIDGTGLVGSERGPVLAGHGFGAMVAATLAERLGARCSGLVLVDGGWEDLAAETDLDADDLLRGLEEPPGVLRSMADYLADREAFDPASWDADQERAARAAVVELPAGRVVPVARPHVLAACAGSMLAYRPLAALAGVGAPVSIVVAGEWTGADATATEAERGPDDRHAALARTLAALVAEGRPSPRVIDLTGVGHNVIRHRPAEVTAAIAGVDRGHGAYHPES